MNDKQYDIQHLPILPITNTRINNLTNKKFGLLTVLGLAPKPENAETCAYWWCVCECNQHKILRVSGKSLKSGNTKSCGCLQKSIAKENALKRNTTLYPGHGNKKDLKNMTFGYLIPLEATSDRANDGSIIWKCKCINDNNIIYASSHLLLNGTIQSCGCIKSKGERKIEQLLLENKIPYKKQFFFQDLYDKNPSFPLKFDFAIFNNNNELLYLIEYDGIQHYQKTTWSNDDFSGRQRRDKLKDTYCAINNIKLIRIPYTKYEQLSIKDILLEDIND